MANDSWSLVGDLAVFNTAKWGDIIVTRSTYDDMRPDIQNINRGDVGRYHEYGHWFNTEVRATELPLQVMQTL